MHTQDVRRLAIPGLMTILLAGCAGSVDRPIAQFASAEAAIEQADDSNAQKHAADRLAAAREKLASARTLSERGDHKEAQRLAHEAEIDARVAIAHANAADSEATAAELAESLRTLEQELARAQGTGR